MPGFVHTAESGGHNKPMRKRANGKFQERIKQDHSNVTDKETAFTTEGRGAIKSDVLGSYTGTAEDYEAPVQDADDL